MKKLIFCVWVMLFFSVSSNAEVISTLKIPSGKISIERFLDKNDIRKNPDGSNFFNTKINIIIEYKDKKQIKELVSGMYTGEEISNAMSPSMLFDPKLEVLTIFMNGKSPKMDYGMEGYAFRYDIMSKTWEKEKIFDNANWGWYSFFDGSNEGQPILWHFSFYGYYAIKSERNLNGKWSNYNMGGISPEQAASVYKKSKNILISSTVGNQAMVERSELSNGDEQVTNDAAVFVLSSLFKLFNNINTSSSSSASGGGSGRSTCFSIRNDDSKNACLANFDGRSTCFSIRNNDSKNACLANFDGRSTCFSIRNDDSKNACLANFDGRSTCFSIKDEDDRNSCLAISK